MWLSERVLDRGRGDDRSLRYYPVPHRPIHPHDGEKVEDDITPFTFIILALAAFRLQRIVTSDEWPPSDWFREKVRSRTGDDSSWTTLVTCPWCFGFWISLAVMAEHHYLGVIPMWVYGVFAVSAIVGYLGTYDS